ncbi:ATP-binding protein [Mongoliitalea daihaiensis]|uniref:ATP-binding protein n=1 Tax=Mongoliitalea daihaiensis TaxID=2782006 RepID=UPI001F1D9B53|nr:ATP-binding protein [Mongoliitalea daihaiensis]UJP63762.1 response regulator [Mongoliitalea daihaiensis]
MSQKTTHQSKFQIGNKVIIGFLLAAVLVVGVSVITFFSIQKLLSTVENLTEPNEKLEQLNGLMADVYLLDMSKTERTSDKDSVLEETERRIKERLDWLKRLADDPLEVQSLEKISMDLSELLVVYAGLEEVRYNLTSRTFSEEALVNIERRIKRQQELSEMQFLGRIRERDFLTEITLPEKKNDSLPSIDEDLELDEDFVEFFKELGEQEGRKTSERKSNERAESTDAALEALKTFMTKMYQDEQRLRQNFIILETRLINKNKDVFYQIQQLIATMQVELLAEYKAKNDSAYELTYVVSVILGILIFLGVAGSLGFVNSILTEIKKGISYRSKLEEAKQKSDDLAKAKQDFLANMSHEIRNPLHAIQGYQQALERTTLDEQQIEYLKMMGYASDTLIGIVNDILDFSKLEAGKINIEKLSFDAASLFVTIRNFYALRAREKQLAFSWQMDLPEGGWLVGDQLRISQIMNNLLSNALKFTSQGFIKTSLTIDAEQWLIIEVEDTGMGMSDEVQATIFQEFHQGDSSITRNFGGTGLGLAITKRLVELLDGEITFRSEQGTGTTFRVILPIELGEASEIDTLERTSQLISLEGYQILLVDDDSIGLRLLRNLLESKGATVMDFNGGVEVLDNLDTDVPLDLAIVDIQMPQVSGIDVLHFLQNQPLYQEIPVLAMTANVFVEEERKLSKEGFTSLLLKPFSESQLMAKLAQLGIGNSKESVDQHDQQEGDSKEPCSLYTKEDVAKFCLGDEELVVEIMGDIIVATEKDLLILQESLPNANFNRIREVTHQLSSRLRQIRAGSAELAKSIEIAIKNGENTKVHKEVEQLIEEVSHVLAVLKKDFAVT